MTYPHLDRSFVALFWFCSRGVLVLFVHTSSDLRHHCKPGLFLSPNPQTMVPCAHCVAWVRLSKASLATRILQSVHAYDMFAGTSMIPYGSCAHFLMYVDRDEIVTGLDSTSTDRNRHQTISEPSDIRCVLFLNDDASRTLKSARRS